MAEALALGVESRRARFDLVDATRGAAIAAMIVYHFAWDLSFLRLVAVDVGGDPAWRLFAMSIAGSFLTLVGVGLALAAEGGLNWRAYLRRLAMISVAALLVTVGTFYATPDGFIFFGILHSIAVSSVFALPFLRAPLFLVALAAVIVFAVPLFVSTPALDGIAWAWLGLGKTIPHTNDYEPIFPWFGCVLVGVILGRLALRPGWREAWARRRAQGPLSRTLVWAGRRSLIIYLLHQPVLLAGLYPLAQWLGPNPEAEVAPFLNACRPACGRAGRSEAACKVSCQCIVDGLKREELWARAVTDRLTPDERGRMTTISGRCFDAQTNGAP